MEPNISEDDVHHVRNLPGKAAEFWHVMVAIFEGSGIDPTDQTAELLFKGSELTRLLPQSARSGVSTRLYDTFFRNSSRLYIEPILYADGSAIPEGVKLAALGTRDDSIRSRTRTTWRLTAVGKAMWRWTRERQAHPQQHAPAHEAGLQEPIGRANDDLETMDSSSESGELPLVEQSPSLSDASPTSDRQGDNEFVVDENIEVAGSEDDDAHLMDVDDNVERSSTSTDGYGQDLAGLREENRLLREENQRLKQTIDDQAEKLRIANTIVIDDDDDDDDPDDNDQAELVLLKHEVAGE